jgi:hypothetical protein
MRLHELPDFLCLFRVNNRILRLSAKERKGCGRRVSGGGGRGRGVITVPRPRPFVYFIYNSPSVMDENDCVRPRCPNESICGLFKTVQMWKKYDVCKQTNLYRPVYRSPKFRTGSATASAVPVAVTVRQEKEYGRKAT